MKKLLLLCIVLNAAITFGQQDALVFFADKENVAASLANPITILTQEALDRKAMHSTPIDERDVPVNEAYKATIENSTGITVYAKSKWMNCVYVRGSETNINNLLDLSFVTAVEFCDKDLNFSPIHQPLDDKFEIENQSRIIYDYGAATNQTEMLAVDYLHENDYTGEDIIVAFLDNGYPNVISNSAYTTLINEGRLLGTYDFVFRQVSPNGTGSHGASTFSDAAAYLESPQPFVGTAPGASYYLYVTEDSGSETPVEEAYWVEALERADSLGVYVTNTSLGYKDFDNSNYDHSYEDLDGLTTIAARGGNHALDKGMITVVSAGNDGNSGSPYVATPADSRGTLTIGAVDSGGDYASFSSIGPTVDGRVKPDVMAQGQSAAIVNQNGNVDFASGTSFSSPIMAGAVASLWQAFPEKNNEIIMQAIRESAHLYENPTDEMGYGIPNFEEAYNILQQLGVEETMLETQFALYPNPVSTDINISFPNEVVNATFSLYNVLGEKVLQKTVSTVNNRVDVSHLPSGMYIATIESNSLRNSYKIIKK